MKKIFIYGTCQTGFVYDNWLKKLDFFKEYQATYCTNGHSIAQNYLEHFKNCDILIYQPISEKWGLGNTQNMNTSILRYCKTECIKICFPYIFLNIQPLINDNNLFTGGSCIDKYRKNHTLDEILNLYDMDKFDFELKTRFENCMNYMRYKENSFCNIKVVDFILDNYKTICLVDSHNHINGLFGSYIAKQIVAKMEVQTSEKDMDILNQTHYKIANEDFLQYSKYMKKELDIDYNLESQDSYYRDIIAQLYNNPHLVKYSDPFFV